MRNRFIGLILTLAVVLASTAVMLAQTPNQPKPSSAKQARKKVAAKKAATAIPKLSGVWKGRNTPADFDHPEGPGMGHGSGWNGKYLGVGFGFLDAKSEQPSMLPWAAARYKATREGSGDSMQVLKNVEPESNCMPGGFPWSYDRAMLDAFEIIQTPKKITMLFSTDGEWRQIFMDGRKNPIGAPDVYMGYSTGRWDGDTLLVETTGISDLTWIDRLGHPHSDALRVEERVHRVGPDRLDVDLLFDDPKTYTKPWKGKKFFYLQKPDVVVTEVYSCDADWQKQYQEILRKELGEIKAP